MLSILFAMNMASLFNTEIWSLSSQYKTDIYPGKIKIASYQELTVNCSFWSKKWWLVTSELESSNLDCLYKAY